MLFCFFAILSYGIVERDRRDQDTQLDTRFDSTRRAEQVKEPHVQAIPSSEVVAYLHGIERKRNSVKKCPEPNGMNYEDACFRSLVEREQNLFLLGPHLLDTVVGTTCTAPYVGCPDIMGFEVNSESQWTLKVFYEAKYGSDRRTVRKLNGLSSLLRELRRDQSYLPQLLTEAIGNYVSVPSTILIPEDEEMVVYLVSPTGNKSVFPKDLPKKQKLGLSNIGIPYSPPASPPSPPSLSRASDPSPV